MTTPPQLHLSRDVPATPDRVFRAWTSPDQIVRWWGGGGVTCPTAEVDLRPGGLYRIANAMPDGNLTWISGTFEVVDRPSRLVYTWSVEPPDGSPAPGEPSVVEVEFQAIDGGTRLTINQTRIPSLDARQLFEAGWNGCLDGLRDLLSDRATPHGTGGP